MSGIYKITSPTGRVYVGQSCDIETRFATYRRVNCKDQSKLYRSFVKYGLKNHKFEIIEYCELSLLNERERYWQDYYNVLEDGLNCILTKTETKSGKLSKETRLKMSKAQSGEKHPNWGKKLSKETCRRISEGQRGKIISKETRKKISDRHKGKPRPWLRKIGLDHHSSIKIRSYNTVTHEVIINNLTQTSKILGCDRELIMNRINGISGVKPFRRLKEWVFTKE